jgi:hypothetical protein
MKLSSFERECEQKIRKIISRSSELGISVRREKLTRGPSFRVKSGNCTLTGKALIFIDRRLPLEQQLSLLTEEVGKHEAAAELPA